MFGHFLMDLGSFFYGFWIYIFGCFLMDFGLNVDNCLIDLLLIVYGFGQARWRVRRSAAHWILEQVLLSN